MSPSTATERDETEGEDLPSVRLPRSEAPHESGFTPVGDGLVMEPTIASECDGHLELALAESTRTEGNLSSLLRGLSALIAGASSAHAANSVLFRELGKLQGLLLRSHERERALGQRVRSLELSLDRTERDAARERASFLEQEDRFLEELIADHEGAITELQQRLTRALATVDPSDERPGGTEAPPKGETLDPLRAEEPATPLGALKLRTISAPALAAPSSSPWSSSEYSLVSGEVSEEYVGGARTSSRPKGP